MGLLTIVLSGPATRRPQALAALKQVSADVEDSDYPHGFEPGNGESFITCHLADVDAAARAVEALGWSLRSHWEKTGPWKKADGIDMADPLVELEKLKSKLRAAGINLGD